ncbi:MAG: hypothetical protein GC164_11785 [Phycisphaera sp.]|nr:hypothetical protein [Phycisphaera sp.]
MTAPQLNLIAAWVGIALGMASGAVIGLKFHDENFLGGFAGWRRRLIRLGHISFFGLAFVNLAFALTFQNAGNTSELWTPAWCLVLGAVAMPSVCFASAFFKPARQVFFVPVGLLLTGVVWSVVLQLRAVGL